MGYFFLGLSDGCVFSDGRKYLSVAMCVRFWLFALLHMFAILFLVFPNDEISDGLVRRKDRFILFDVFV